METKSVNFDDLVGFTNRQNEAKRAVIDKKFVLYGGAMGGGKSYFLRWILIWLLVYYYKRYGKRGIVVGLFCEDYPSLKDRHINKIKFEFPAWLGSYKNNDHNFVLAPKFGQGIIAFRNLDDISKYKSSEFAAIAVDELTQNPLDIFIFLRTRLRWSGISDTKFIAATNPGGVGHLWVKERWLDGKFPENESERDEFVFVPALATDNPHLDNSYVNSLKSLPENLRKAYLEGSWDVFEGQYFTEWEPRVHVVEPFTIPDGWKKFRSIDVGGKNGITSCHWYALDYDGNVWVYREYYSTGHESDYHAREITRISVDQHGNEEDYEYTVIDSAAFNKTGIPETTAEVYMRNGVYNLVPSSKDRVMGWDAVHRYLRWDNNTQPKLKVFNHCINLIRTIPSLVHDHNIPEDIDSDGEDHAADELRYLLQTLRDYKTPKPMTAVERRLQQIREEIESDY